MSARCEPTDVNQEEPALRTVCEEDLPICVRDVLNAARASRPDSEVTCVAFRTMARMHDAVRMQPQQLVHGLNAGSTADRLRKKELLVLSVSVTETTFDGVCTVTHVLVVRIRRQRPSEDRAAPDASVRSPIRKAECTGSRKSGQR